MKVWVLEWYHKQDDEWYPVNAETTLKQIRYVMRLERLKANRTLMRNRGKKFRITKYVRPEVSQ